MILKIVDAISYMTEIQLALEASWNAMKSTHAQDIVPLSLLFLRDLDFSDFIRQVARFKITGKFYYKRRKAKSSPKSVNTSGKDDEIVYDESEISDIPFFIVESLP